MTQPGEQELHRWVEASHIEYGGDPWCFIRELAQNSRDADATRIEVTCGVLDTGEEWITFSDNGKGMAWVNAQAFLLKLYASGKDETQDYAGAFGVGFWTVLLFKPNLILISSRTDEESWGLKVDRHLAVTRQECGLESRGTSITLIRNSLCSDVSIFRNTIAERVTYYCRFLTCRLSDHTLQTFCEGKKVSSELTLGVPHEYAFKSKNLRGVVAISDKPKVELFVKGIPVWQGCSLNELKQVHDSISSDTASSEDFDQAPAFLLDARKLRVSLTRREVIRNQELDAIIRQAQRALCLYLEKQADIAFPPKFGQTVRRWLSLHRSRLLILLIMMLLLPLLLYTVNSLIRSPFQSGQAENYLQMDSPPLYQGPLPVNPGKPPTLPFEFSYNPPDPLFFRWFTAADYDEINGWNYSPSQPSYHYEELMSPLDSPQYTITLRDFKSERVPLPVPALSRRFRLLTASPHPLLPVTEIRNDLLFLRIPDSLEKVLYHTYASDTGELDSEERPFWLKCPDLVNWPESWQNMITHGRSAIESDRLHLVLRVMSANFLYRQDDADRRTRTGPSAKWLNRAIESGMGDCDFVNGFAVLLLRSLDIPARLVIGWQGHEGKLERELHAWCEAFVNDSWVVLDYSNKIPRWVAPRPTVRPVSPMTPFLIPFSLIIAGILFLGFLIALMKSRFMDNPRIQPRHTEREKPQEIRSRLIQSARSAVLRPRVWGTSNAIWDLRLLPSFPQTISLREAVTAFNKGRLITVTDPAVPPPSLNRPFTKNRFIRFNSGETDEICRLLPRNLDLLELSWHELNMPQQPPIEELNILLAKNPHGRWKIIELDRLVRSEPLRWFDLRRIQGSSRAYGSNRLILISRDAHPHFKDAMAAWEWICDHHNGLCLHTIRRITGRLLRAKA